MVKKYNWLRARLFKATIMILLSIVPPGLAACSRGRTAEHPNLREEQQRRTRELQKIAAELREAILRRDIDILLKYIVIGPNDFSSYEDAKRVLQMPAYSISCLLFDTKCQQEELRRSGGENNPYQISVAEFFEKHPNLRIEMRFFGRKDPLHGPESTLGLVQILYIVRGSSYDVQFPQWLSDKFPLKQWGKEYVEACMRYTKDGWRYYSPNTGIFFCDHE